MSRGPLEVLREAGDIQMGRSFYSDEDLRKAIDQFNDLVFQVGIALRFDRITDGLRNAAKPFTPGQDSEGGHGR